MNKQRDISNELQIKMYMHCGLCLEEKPPHLSPQEFGSIEVGTTKQGFQIWCKRHNCNVMHIDFEGQIHPANTTRKDDEPRGN